MACATGAVSRVLDGFDVPIQSQRALTTRCAPKSVAIRPHIDMDLNLVEMGQFKGATQRVQSVNDCHVAAG
jgi:hypothetical protein